MKRVWKTPELDYYNLYADMLQQPHLLIAGATGSGKSVVINGMMTTALKDSPAVVQFILIEFLLYIYFIPDIFIISEHLPGAFIIYRADKKDDELIFANDEFLHMSGYKDIDELFRLTEKSFRNLIREDEQQQIESSIWEQIDNGNENDYIHFHLRKADGTYFSVLDHGRIVESPQYGKVFYVLFMDWEDMHIRYNDKFAR